MKWNFTTILVLIASVTFSQTKISGVVTDQKQRPLTGANIYLEGTYEGASSGLDGKFDFETQLSGDFTLKVEFIGFESWSEEVTLNGEALVFQVALNEKFNELNAATITAGAFEAGEARKAVVLKPLDIVTTAGASGDITGALQTLPGTTTVGESGRLFVRGGHAEETQTFIDGLMVFSPYGASAPNTATRGRFNPFMFSGTIFSTGGYSAEYGQALSSALILNTKDMPVEDQFDLGIMSVGLDAAVTRLWDKGSVTAHAGYIDLSPYIAVVPQDFDWQQPYRSWTGSANVRQKVNDNSMLKMYVNGSRSTFKLNQVHPDFPQGRWIDMLNDNLFVNTSYSGLVGEKTTLRTGIAFTDDLIHTGLEDGDFDEKLRGMHGKVAVGIRASERIKFNTGAEVLQKKFGQSFLSDTIDWSDNFQDEKIASFAEADWYASQQLVLRVGVRGEHSTLIGETLLAPRFSAAWKTSEKSQFSLAYGWFYQDPWNELLLEQRELSTERADHYILNFQHIDNDRIFRIEGYYKMYDQLVHRTEDGMGLDNSGHGYAKGIDVFFRDKKTIKNGDYWISYSWLDTQRNWHDYPGLSTPGFASRHNVSVVYKHWIQEWRTMLGATFRYSTPRTFDDPNTTDFNTGRTKPFQTLDANIAYLYKQNVIFYFSASNLMGRENVFGYEFASQPDANGFFTSTPIVPSAPRFFVVGCFITFTKKGINNQLDKLN